MFFKKLGNFFMQLFLLPFSCLLNLLVVAPVVFTFQMVDERMDIGPVILSYVVCFPLGFLLAKLITKIKGKKTEDVVEYTEWVRDVTTTHHYSGDRYTGYTQYISDPYEAYYRETSMNGWGWFSIITSFIAFPLRLIALIMSMVALFVKSIYSTCWTIDKHSGTGNVILHALFDFIIVPIGYAPNPSAKGLLFFPLYLVLFVGINLVNMIFASQSFLITFDEAFEIIFVLVTFIFVLITFITMIKFTVATCRDWSVKNGFKNGMLYVLGGLIPTFAMLLYGIIVYFINKGA